MQRYFAEHAVIDGDYLKLVRSTLSADDKGNLVLYEDVEAELATLRSENERLRDAVDRLCTEMEYIHEASSAVESDVRCLIRTSEGERAIAQARALLTQATQKDSE